VKTKGTRTSEATRGAEQSGAGEEYQMCVSINYIQECMSTVFLCTATRHTYESGPKNNDESIEFDGI
jgi:hypothetical protein